MKEQTENQTPLKSPDEQAPQPSKTAETYSTPEVKAHALDTLIQGGGGSNLDGFGGQETRPGN